MSYLTIVAQVFSVVFLILSRVSPPITILGFLSIIEKRNIKGKKYFVKLLLVKSYIMKNMMT